MFNAATYLTSVPCLGTLTNTSTVRGDAVAITGRTGDKLESVKVDALTSKDTPNAADTAVAANKDDPVWKYATETPDAHTPHGDPDKVTRTFWRLLLRRQVKDKLAFTVNAGEAFIVATPAKPDQKPVPPIQKIIDSIMYWYIFLLKALSQTKEQKQRIQEIKCKVKELIKKNIGDNIDEYIYISVVAVSPEARGKGYDRALVQTIADIADAQGRTTWLTATDQSSVDFYEELGFKEVDRVLLGDDNPTWKEDPVPVPLLVREPKEKKNLGEKAIFMV